MAHGTWPPGRWQLKLDHARLPSACRDVHAKSAVAAHTRPPITHLRQRPRLRASRPCTHTLCGTTADSIYRQETRASQPLRSQWTPSVTLPLVLTYAERCTR
eukprot:6175618-Pleurochrysis_carterae.AAC.2